MITIKVSKQQLLTLIANGITLPMNERSLLYEVLTKYSDFSEMQSEVVVQFSMAQVLQNFDGAAQSPVDKEVNCMHHGFEPKIFGMNLEAKIYQKQKFHSAWEMAVDGYLQGGFPDQMSADEKLATKELLDNISYFSKDKNLE